MNIEHKECYVAFLDILGFQGIVKERSSHEILQIFRDIKKNEKEFNMKYIGRNVELIDELQKRYFFRIMSDSIVIAIEKSLPGSYNFIVNCCKIIQNKLLLSHNIILRGGISYGLFYGDEEIMFGVGLIKAYDLENKSAIYPRIIIDNEIISDTHKSDPKIRIYLDEIKQDDVYDSLHYISYLTISDYNEIKRTVFKFIEMQISKINLLKDDGKGTKENIILKYEWLKDYAYEVMEQCEYINQVENTYLK